MKLRYKWYDGRQPVIVLVERENMHGLYDKKMPSKFIVFVSSFSCDAECWGHSVVSRFASVYLPMQLTTYESSDDCRRRVKCISRANTISVLCVTPKNKFILNLWPWIWEKRNKSFDCVYLQIWKYRAFESKRKLWIHRIDCIVASEVGSKSLSRVNIIGSEKWNVEKLLASISYACTK